MCDDNASVLVTDAQMDPYALYKVIIDVYIVGPLCLVGFVGNALSIAVLYRDHDKKNTTNWLLQTLAVIDTLYLMACVFIQSIKTINDHTDWIPELKNTLPYMERYIWVFASTAQTITVWTVMLVTLDRYMAICRPLSTQLRSLDRAKLAVGAVVLLAILYNIPRFFERRPTETVDECGLISVTSEKTSLGANNIYFMVYKTLGYFIFRAIGPLLTISYLNYKLIRALQEVRRRHQDLTRSGRHRENITLMLVVVVCVFVVCTLPDFLLRLTFTVGNFNKDNKRALQYVNAITNMLLTVNSSINFLIYCLIGKKFRKILKQMYSCGSRSSIHEVSESEALTTKVTCAKLSEAEPLTTVRSDNGNDNANGGSKDGDTLL